MFETTIDVFCRWTGEFVLSTTIETAKRLTMEDCRQILLDDGHDLGMISISFVSMRVRPDLPQFINNDFKLAENRFRARVKSRN